MKVIIGVDGGNFKGKVVGPGGAISFHSNICDWFERASDERFGSDDMEFLIEGRRGFAGTIAKIEDEYGGGNMMGDSKAHEEAKIRILLALHRYCKDGDEIYLVTGQPIAQHTQTEKEKIKQMLKGRREVTVNGITKVLFIEGVEVAPEGSAAIWATETPESKVRILDIGSGTVNAATLIDKRHVTTQSTTFNFGVETLKNNDVRAMARGIIKNTTKKWHKNDTVLICGGVAELIAPYIREHYNNAEAMTVYHRNNGRVDVLKPVYANAAGFYELAKRRFK